MTFNRIIQVISEASSWPNGTIPSEIASKLRLRNTNINRALLHIGLWTRPPYFRGFDLADCWAWLRYARMFASCPDLRFRTEWTDIDSHQKTVASDELGVGFTTQFFIEELGFQLYVDTRLLCELLPSLVGIGIGLGKKQGPEKAPDYIAFDRYGCLSVLECKGSQTSLRDLQAGIRKGQLQKTNVIVSASAPLRYSLVAGVFVPQAGNREVAALQINDPSWTEVTQLLSETPRRQLLIAMARITLAKHFSLMGLSFLAHRLMNRRLSEHSDPHLFDFRNELTMRQIKMQREHLDFAIEMPLPPLENGVHEADTLSQAHGIRFEMKYDVKRYDELVNAEDIEETLYRLMLGLTEEVGPHSGHWMVREETDISAEITSPFGFSLKLEYLL